MAPQSAFHGVLTALMTPMQPDGSVDYDAFGKLVQRQLAGGVHGLVPCGTTGEAPTLSSDEQDRLIRMTVELAAGRVPVMGGIGSNDTRKAIENARRAQDAGVTGVLATAPYYNKPNQAGLLQHFTAIADAVDVEVCVYDIPGRSVIKVEPATLAQLAAHPRITCVKDATGDLVNAVENRRLCGPDFGLLSGDDFTLVPFWSVGGHGCISVLSNVFPEEVVALYDSVMANDWASARARSERLFPLVRALFREPNPTPGKAALAHLRLCEDTVRLPLVAASAEAREAIVAAMHTAGWSA